MPSNTPQYKTEHITLSKAYQELAAPHFAVWIRLHVATDDELAAGRARIAKLVRYSEPQSNVILRELQAAGYIKLVPNVVAMRPTSVVLLKRALLSGRDKFVKLSNLAWVGSTAQQKMDLDDFNENFAKLDTMPAGETGAGVETLCHGLEKSHHPAAPSNKNCKGDGGFDQIMQTRSVVHTSLTLPQVHDNERETVGQNRSDSPDLAENAQSSCSASVNKSTDRIEQNQPIKRTKSWVFGEVPGIGVPFSQPPNSSHRVDTKKLLERKNSKKLNLISEANQRARETKARPKTIDWSKMTEKDTKDVTFEPTKQQLARYRDLIKRDGRDPEKNKLLNKLSWKINKEYSNYFAAKTGREYMPSDKDFVRGREGAIEFISKGISPIQAIKYWDKHIHTFHGGKLKYPPLSLICSNWGAEQVACARFDERGEPVAAKEKPEAPKAHGFSDLDELDKRLRPALKAAGFEDVERMKDDLLLFIQKNSVSIAKGVDLWIDPSVRPHVKWTAKNFAPKWIEIMKANKR